MCAHVCAHVCARSSRPGRAAAPSGTSALTSPTSFCPPSGTLGSSGPETPGFQAAARSGRKGCNDSASRQLCEFCKDSLPQRGSSLLKAQAAAFPRIHTGKAQTLKIFTKSRPSVNQQAFTDRGRFHTRLGTVQGKRGRATHRPCPAKVRGREELWLAGGAGGWGCEGSGEWSRHKGPRAQSHSCGPAATRAVCC